MSEHIYWQMIRDLVESGRDAGLPRHQIRASIVHKVHAADAAGEPWAAETLTRWCDTGADDDYGKVYKDANSVTYIRADGRRVRKTVAYSRPKRSKEDGAIVGRQMQAWWAMTRPAVEELRREIAGQAERLIDIITALDLLIEAMDRHPDARTAREAWEADGHSVDEIDLGDVAA